MLTWYQETLQLFKQLVRRFIDARLSDQQPKQRVPHKYKQLTVTISLREVFLICLGHSSRAKGPNQWATWDKKVHTSAIWDKNRKLGKYPISHFKRQLLWGPSLWLKIIFWILSQSREKRALIQILSWNEWVGSIWRWPKTVFHYDSRYFLDGVNLPLSLSLSGSFSGCQWERKLMHFSCRKRIKLLFVNIFSSAVPIIVRKQKNLSCSFQAHWAGLYLSEKAFYNNRSWHFCQLFSSSYRLNLGIIIK